MKWYNKLISKIGVDKLLHALCGFIIVSLFSGWSIGMLLIGMLASMVAGVAKELIDDKADWNDTVATAFGGILAVIVFGARIVLLGF